MSLRSPHGERRVGAGLRHARGHGVAVPLPPATVRRPFRLRDPILPHPGRHELEGFGAVADGVLLGGAEFTESTILIGGHEERIVAETFGADLGFKNFSPALADELTHFLVRSEECEVTFETCAALMEWGLLHGF